MKIKKQYNRDICFSWMVVLCIFLYNTPLTGAIDCYACQNIPNLSDCHNVTSCLQSKYCLQTYDDQTQTFTLKCDDGNVCPVGSTTTSSIGPVTTLVPSTTNAAASSPTTPAAVNSSTTPVLVSTIALTTSTEILNSTTTLDVKNITTTTTLLPTKANSASTSVPGSPRASFKRETATTLCCDVDACNKHAADTTTAPSTTIILVPTHPNNSCHDKHGFDCHIAITYLDVCSDIQKAKVLCKQSCNLCDLIDGNWTEWSDWSGCDVTCGNGLKSRSRNCSNPEPANGGDNCTGSDMENDNCTERDCPLDGSWAQWTNWSDCSVTCGVGLQKRYRNCSQPYPEADGLFCLGASSDDQICYKSPCYDGFWESWSAWGECSHTCGSGLKTRTRNCSSEYGHMCLGDSFEADTCIEKECAGSTNIFNIGQWNDWLPWISCSATCGVALKSRARSCSGTVCTGSYQEFDTCTLDDCPEPMSAFLVDGVAIEGPENRTLILTHVITNVGNDYDNSTGQFHCRIPGLYSFSVSIEKSPDVSEAFCHLMKNNSTTIFVGSRSAFYHDKTYQQASNSGILELKRGDIVYLGKCTTPVTFTEKSTFSGTLLVAKSDDS